MRMQKSIADIKEAFRCVNILFPSFQSPPVLLKKAMLYYTRNQEKAEIAVAVVNMRRNGIFDTILNKNREKSRKISSQSQSAKWSRQPCGL